ncbi:hypothetical protein [Natrinema hispanicum]|uniref:Uncharacterized protein n=1 Tax=Natrinema hispanicum TaxID=392421 RepID=A0A1I0BK49_9EURY|nr:hypothetical protein [Natrinema hispanicum]SDC33327.1 hypothetical protein SAMN05192552_100343 [Natrinema hispanicum]SET07225.1 hypothetical protein SAMN04488694_103265 [Natrinema hispanicum]
MDAIITGESERIGLSVFDNNDVEHLIEMDESGDIKYHEQDGYPDKAAKRTPEGNEHVSQTRKFAQYYVFAERGYDTVPPLIHPERLNLVRQAIESMSTEKCMDLFGDLYQQMASHHIDTERIVDIPSGVGEESVLYRKDIYLGVDPTETEVAEEAISLASEYGIDLDEPDAHEQSVTDLDTNERTAWEEFGDALGDLVAENDADVSEAAYIDSVSTLHMAYLDSRGREHVTEATQPLDREPDARFELVPIDLQSPEDFQEYLAFNLKCQIRDCFVRMGVQPPGAFQVLGYGRYEATERYNKVEFYPKYHDPKNEALLK